MSTEKTPCDCITAPCGCPYIEDTATVDHTNECRRKQAAEDRARQVGAGACAYGTFIAAHPDLLALAGEGNGVSTNFYFWTINARAKIEAFVVALAADGWTLTEQDLAPAGYAGVNATKGGFSLHLRTPAENLADGPKPPPRPTYRPLLAPADATEGGASDV